jgi:hypothetical protein
MREFRCKHLMVGLEHDLHSVMDGISVVEIPALGFDSLKPFFFLYRILALFYSY